MRRIYPAELIDMGWSWRIASKSGEPARTVWTGPLGERYEINGLALILDVDD